MSYRSSLLSILAAVSLVSSGCAPAKEEAVSTRNLVVAGDSTVNRTIGDEAYQFGVMGEAALKQGIAAGTFAEAGSAAADNALSAHAEADTAAAAAAVISPRITPLRASLLFNMPMSLLGKPMMFGGVVTRVSEKKDEALGGLKLSDLAAFQVKPSLAKTLFGAYQLRLLDCGANCATASSSRVVISFPVTAVDNAAKKIVVDLSGMGTKLNLKTIPLAMAQVGQTQYKVADSRTLAFDYSKETLVFDVETALRAPTAGAPAVQVVSRWYLRLGNIFNPAFVARAPVAGVGFFETERSKTPLIQRFDVAKAGAKGAAKYYVKQVPAEFQKAFASAFDAWNEKLVAVTGKKVFDYEFIPAGDPRSAALVPGDVRYNIVEWDVDNAAGYGGLGPSIAHQYTGENFSANVLVQGPAIMEIYTTWFKANQRAQELRAEGRDEAAEALLARVQRRLNAKLAGAQAKAELKLGEAHEFRIPSQTPAFEDPKMQRVDFEEIPAGMTFQAYMDGYFHDLLAHELGHNLGLRHNFRGNLGFAGMEVGKVSRSIMEYLGKGFRHLDKIGEYDVMAMSYAYLGKVPAHTDWFCTDENQIDLANPNNSAECSKDDATDDPFGYFGVRMNRALDLLLARGKNAAPAWKVEDMKREVDAAFAGMGAYAASATATSRSWTNFFGLPGRPARAADVKPFVLGAVRAILCDSRHQAEIAAKNDPQARAAAAANLTALRTEAAQVLAPVFRAQELACGG